MQKVEIFPAIDTVTGRPPVDDFQREWYSKHLMVMAEMTLPEGPGETYRFLWLRSFHHPIAVRLVCIEKACELTGLRTDGKGGYEPGSVVERKTRSLSDGEVARFREMVARMQFWRPQPSDDRIGLDGAHWILEGRRGQAYHLWDVWSPEDVRAIGSISWTVPGIGSPLGSGSSPERGVLNRLQRSQRAPVGRSSRPLDGCYHEAA